MWRVCICMRQSTIRFFFLFVSSFSFFSFFFLSKVQLIHGEDWLAFYRFQLCTVCYQFFSWHDCFSSPRKSASQKLKGILHCTFFPSISKTIFSPPPFFTTHTLKLLLQFDIEFGNLTDHVNSFFLVYILCFISCSFRIAFDSFFLFIYFFRM